MANSTTDILDQVKNMQLFALGNPTSRALGKYSIQSIINPNYPDIHTLSDLIYKMSIAKGKKNYVITKTN